VQSLDRLDIDTPEQIALELPLAGIGSRFLALTVDTLLQVVAVVAIIIVGVIIASSTTASDWPMLDRFFSQTIGAIVMVLLPFCLYWGYFAFFEILWQGRTPGKRIAGIRVIHQTGRPMTAIECIGRNLMRGVDIIPGMYGVGLICMMCNKQNKRLGDFIAGTIVVHDKTIEAAAPNWGNKSEAATLQPEIAKLSADDLVLIETYLSRRYEINQVVRRTTAERIVAMIAQKTGMPKPADQADDDFLEAIARQLRDGAAFRSHALP
jgi:uncharacterized RDD family membrane protein YckC